MDSLRRPVPRNQFVPAMGVPVELNDPPKLPTVPVSRNLQTSRLGLLPTRRRKAPQRAEKRLANYFLPQGAKQETGILQAANPPEQQSQKLEAHSHTAVLLNNLTAPSVVASARRAATNKRHRDQSATSSSTA